MSTAEEELDLAVGWASLAEDDPERVDAYGRAQHNPALQTILGEGERLMRILAAYTVPPPAEAVLRRIEARLIAEMNREASRSHHFPTAEIAKSRSGQSWLGLLIPISVALSWLSVLLLSDKPVLSNPRMVSSLALALVATAGAMSVFRLRALVALGVSALGLTAALVAGKSGGLGPANAAVHCLASSLGAASLPLATATVLALKGKLRLLGSVRKLRTEPGASCGVAGKAGGRRNTHGISSPDQHSQARRRECPATGGVFGQSPDGNWVFAGIGACGALAGAAALEITCATRVMGHLVAFHAGGVLLAALIGWGLASLPALKLRA